MKKDKNLNSDFKDLKDHFSTSRRDFLKLLGGGIFVFFYVSVPFAVLAQQRRGRLPSDFNAFLRIGEDGRVTCFTGKVELGQGVMTSLAQMLADELDVLLENTDTSLCCQQQRDFLWCRLKQWQWVLL